MDYLTKADLETLSKYKYHAVASTKLDDILNQYWWIPVSNFIPKVSDLCLENGVFVEFPSQCPDIGCFSMQFRRWFLTFSDFVA